MLQTIKIIFTAQIGSLPHRVRCRTGSLENAALETCWQFVTGSLEKTVVMKFKKAKVRCRTGSLEMSFKLH